MASGVRGSGGAPLAPRPFPLAIGSKRASQLDDLMRCLINVIYSHAQSMVLLKCPSTSYYIPPPTLTLTQSPVPSPTPVPAPSPTYAPKPESAPTHASKSSQGTPPASEESSAAPNCSDQYTATRQHELRWASQCPSCESRLAKQAAESCIRDLGDRDESRGSATPSWGFAVRDSHGERGSERGIRLRDAALEAKRAIEARDCASDPSHWGHRSHYRLLG